MRQSTRTYERGALSRPPPRRDPRAELDDDEPSSTARVDIVGSERGSSPGDRNSSIDSLTNAALTLRRELAKLHQQAAAVERTIEDQRRDQRDAFERAEHVSSKNLELEERVHATDQELVNLRRLHEQTVADLQSIRNERDELAQATETAKAVAEDLLRTRDELGSLRRTHEDTVRAAGTLENEIAEIRKREQASTQQKTDVETELQGTREKFERANAELTSARDEIASTRNELVKAKQEANDAAEAATHKLAESEHERLAVKEQVDRLDKQVAELKIAQEKVVALDADLTTARTDLLNARADAGRLERDLEDVRRARDVQTERATMAEGQVENHRKDIDRLHQQLEAANATAVAATQKAARADVARLAGEEAVRTLRDEVTTAFARWRSVAPSIVPPSQSGSVAPPTRAVPLSDFIPQAAPVPREDSMGPPVMQHPPREPSPVTAPPSAMAGVQMKAPSIAPAPTPTVSGPPPPPGDLEWDDVKPAEAKPKSVAPPRPASERPSASMRVSAPPPSASMRASQRPPSVSKLPAVSPPSQRPPPESTKSPASMPPRSAAPRPSRPDGPPPLAPASLQGPRSVPPPLPIRSSVSVPPAVYPSVPPMAPLPLAGTTSVTPTQPPPPMVRTEDSSVVTYVSEERETLIEKLGTEKSSRDAAVSLREHPEWLRGRPPIELLLALTHLDYDVEEPVFELARAWDRDPLCRALIAALRDEPDAKLREHGAWLLKHLGSAASWPSLAELVSSEDESPPVRRWLLEAIERLVASRTLSWNEVGDLCQRLVRHTNPSLRDGTIGVIAALDRSDDKRRLLLDVLRTDHDEVVLASAVQALTTALPIELDPSVAERLLGHPSARVQQSVVEFIDRSKRAAKNN